MASKTCICKIAFKVGKDYLHVPFFRDWHLEGSAMGLDETKK